MHACRLQTVQQAQSCNFCSNPKTYPAAAAACCSGTGIKVPLGSRVTVEGLQSNETYNFAIAGKPLHVQTQM
jgi:hypothetical protein